MQQAHAASACMQMALPSAAATARSWSVTHKCQPLLLQITIASQHCDPLPTGGACEQLHREPGAVRQGGLGFCLFYAG